MKTINSKVKSQKAKDVKVVSGRWSVAVVSTSILFLLLTAHCSVLTVRAQSTEFTYQGRLLDNSLPATANYDFEFSLWDGLVSPPATQQGTTQTVTGVAVANGIFTVKLNFGAQFTGAARFMQIAVRPAGGPSYTTLAPRQPITSSPYSIKSASSTSADGLSPACNLCVTDAHILSIDGAKVTGTVANATNAVNATTATSATTAGNVTGVVAIANGGTGSSTQNFVDLTTDQTGIAGSKTFTGVLSMSSGSALTPSLTFSGDTDTGFFRSAPDTLRFSTGGVSRMVINPNGRIGVGTEMPATPIRFFAVEDNPTAATAYSVYGQALGTTGFRAGVVGESAFTSPQSGSTTGFGVYGFASGATANTGLYGLAVGAGTVNYGVYGSASGATQNWAGYFQGDTKVTGSGIIRSYINSDSNAGVALTLNDQPGWSVATANGGHFQIYNDAIAQNAFWIDKMTNNIGIGTTNPLAQLDVADPFIGLRVNVADPNGYLALFGPRGEFAIANDDSQAGRFRVMQNGVVQINMFGSGSADTVRLDVRGYIRTNLSIGGTGGVCTTSDSTLAYCSSSIRYKNEIRDFSPGVNLIRRLRPVSFTWKKDGQADFGLVAEEVAAVEPLLATYNQKGEIEGVKYDRIGVIAVNAIKEQQAEIHEQMKKIEDQNSKIKDQQKQINELKIIVCSLKPDAAICKQEEK